MAKLEILKSSPFFSELNEAELAVIEPVVQEKTLPPGTTLFLEGMLGESMYIIVSGSIKISKMISEGEEQVLAMLGEGECFGEMALLDGGPRSASAVSTAETKIITLRRKDFVELGQTQPAVCLKLMWALVKDFSKRIRDNAARYSQLLAGTYPKVT